ncbi:unnamed protein product [Paramecium pentaurelia]|uniref:Uncharacterized protein n=1 Tax=Paramecium pentaurelia TaxID=43138 RepID=A0A8S1VEZ2_9CILI|nr:unnamed protein product [Paramecium pentaurelia]
MKQSNNSYQWQINQSLTKFQFINLLDIGFQLQVSEIILIDINFLLSKKQTNLKNSQNCKKPQF